SIMMLLSLEAFAPEIHTTVLIKDEALVKVAQLYQVSYNEAKMLCTDGNIDANWLLAVIWIESRFNRRAVSPIGARGYIQFTPKTLNGGVLNDSTEFTLTREYIKFYSKKIKSYEDLYLAIFFPKALNKPDSYVLATQRFSAYTIAKSNPILNLNKDSLLTKAEVKLAAFELLPDSLKHKL
ncbi:transglycosylase SLT domain-containing protein, partial [Romboutsia sp.]|uniref:transglycosylase SLT domain-containing protein n=1 Tax=Romboutsia sp. TaxID=1965302 RepID=UPI003F31E43F